jgi:hypothetical protein
MMDRGKIERLWKDAGWRGALTILIGSPQLSNDGRVWEHVDLDREEIRFSKILKDGTFSSGERTLIEIAASLFNQDVTINLWEAFNRLGDQSTKLAITAICNFAHIRGLETLFASREIGQLNRNVRENYSMEDLNICNRIALN